MADPVLLELDNLEVVSGSVVAPTNRLLTLVEAAQYLGVHETTLNEWVRANAVGGWFRLGKLIRFHAPSLESWVVKQVEATNDSLRDSNPKQAYWSEPSRARGKPRVVHYKN